MTHKKLQPSLTALALLLACSSEPEPGAPSACGNACPAGQQCSNGACVPAGSSGAAGLGAAAGAAGSAGVGAVSGGSLGSGGALGIGGTNAAGAGQSGSGGSGGAFTAGGSNGGVGAAGASGAASGNAGAPSGGQGGASGGTSGAGGKAGSGGASGAASGSGGKAGSGGGAGDSGGNGNVVGQCATTLPGLPTYNGNGSVTFYTFAMGSNCQNAPPTNKCVNCGFPVTATSPDTVAHAYTGSGRYFAAMNTDDFNGAAACGACVEVTRDGGRKVIATVVDQCPIATNPVCKRGHIDLSREAFLQLGSESEGHLGTGNGGRYGSISWKYIPCPVPASQNVTLRLKEPNNQYYTAVVVQDHTYPIKSVKIKGANATRDPQSNFWMVGSGDQSPGPWKVQAIDINGWGFETTLSQGQAGDVSTGHRVTCP